MGSSQHLGSLYNKDSSILGYISGPAYYLGKLPHDKLHHLKAPHLRSIAGSSSSDKVAGSSQRYLCQRREDP